MKQFIQKYSLLFFIFFPIWFIVGNIFAPISLVILFVYLIFLYRRGADLEIILLLFIILILGDSRSPIFQYVKPARVLITVFIFILSLIDLKIGIYKLKKIYLWLVPFLLVSITGLFASPDIVTAITKTISYFLIIFIAIHYISYRVVEYKFIIFRDITFLLLLVYLIGLLIFPMSPSFVMILTPDGSRFRGLFGNPNGLGTFSTLNFILLTIIQQLSPNLNRVINTTKILLIVSVLLSGSRTALGSIIMFYSVYFLYQSKVRKLAPYLLWLVIVPNVLFWGTQVDWVALLDTLQLSSSLRADRLVTGSGRFFAWEIAVEKIVEAPLFGGGFGYNEYYFRSLREFFLTTEHNGLIHNSYLTFIFNNGYVGLVSICTFFIIWLRKVKVKEILTPFLLAVLISSNFEDWLTGSLNSFFIFFLLAIIFMQNFYVLKKLK